MIADVANTDEARRSTTIFNEAGDQTIVWTADRDAAMESIIRKKMKEGVQFFIIERRGDDLPPGRVPLTSATEARKYRALSIPDEDFAKFVKSGAGDVVRTPRGRVTKSKLSRDPAEVAKSRSVGTRQRAGG